MNKTLQFISLLIIAAKILTTIFKSGIHSEQYYLELSGVTQSLNYGIFAGFLFAINVGGKLTQKTKVYLKYTFGFCVVMSTVQLYTLLPGAYSSLIYWVLVPVYSIATLLFFTLFIYLFITPEKWQAKRPGVPFWKRFLLSLLCYVRVAAQQVKYPRPLSNGIYSVRTYR